MTTAHVQSVDHLSNLPNEDVGTQPVLRVETDLPLGVNNAFYMHPVDFDGNPVSAADMKMGDLILFDEPDGIFHKRVSWNGRGFRQIGYSFDWGDQQHNAQ